MSYQQYLQQLLANHYRRLQKLNKKWALQGLNADPSILIEIEIERLQAKLEQVGLFPSSLSEGEPKKAHQEDVLKPELSGCELLVRLLCCQMKLACLFVKFLIKFIHCIC